MFYNPITLVMNYLYIKDAKVVKKYASRKSSVHIGQNSSAGNFWKINYSKISKNTE